MGHTLDDSNYTEVPVKRFSRIGMKNEAITEISDKVIVESKLTIFYGDNCISLDSCSSTGLEYLAVGHLLTKGIIKYNDDLVNIRHPIGTSEIHIEINQPEMHKDSCLKQQIQPSLSCESHPVFTPGIICDIFFDLLKRSTLFKMTGGTHAAALCDNKGILLWHEDIGRHNAVDKIIGHAYFENVSLNNKMIALTGRINTEIIDKVVSVGVPIVSSKAPATDMAIKIALEKRITVIGFVRDHRMTVYSGSERIGNIIS